ncbi:mucin-5B-like isoform X2 [Mercenaria mercenaria]|uniref:mucin-5B-like isoform X2 n=1 Tax=Mercenaria mercenaria TaxID=6596 RepID=UPI00234E6086|nr:mucin-5B-like isoform X2 [Mercenaria mercenaria]
MTNKQIQTRLIWILIFVCSSAGLRVFDSCDEDGSSCPTGSRCMWKRCEGKRCICEKNLLPSVDNSRCVKETPLGEKCQKDSMCMGQPLSECRLNTNCTCLEGYRPSVNGKYCVLIMKGKVTAAEYGQFCDNEKFSCFPDDLRCFNKKCACEPGFRLATTEEIYADPYSIRYCRPESFKLGVPVNVTGTECQKQDFSTISKISVPVSTPSTTSTTRNTTPTSTTPKTTSITTTPSTTSLSTTPSTTSTSTTPSTTSTSTTSSTTSSSTIPSTTSTSTTSSTTSPTTTPSTTSTTPSTTSTSTIPSTISTSTTPSTTSSTTTPSTTLTSTTTSTTSASIKPSTTSISTTPSTTSTSTTSSTTSTSTTPSTTSISTTPSTTSTSTKPSITSISTTPSTRSTSTTSSITSTVTTPSTTSTSTTPSTTSASTTSSITSTVTTPSTTSTSTTNAKPYLNSTVIRPDTTTAGIGDKCHNRKCQVHSECVMDACDVERCRCELGYANSADGKSCWKLAALGEECASERICQGQKTQCGDKGVCECEDGYETSDSGRWCRLKTSWFIDFPVVGEECSGGFFSQCYMQFEQTCVSGKCRCKDGFREIVDKHDMDAVYPDIVQCRNETYKTGKREEMLCLHQSRETREYDMYDRAKTKIRKIQGAIIGGCVGFVALLGIVISVVALVRWKRWCIFQKGETGSDQRHFIDGFN